MRWRAGSLRVLGLGLLATLAGFGHVVYPVGLLLATRNRPVPEPPAGPAHWPPVSVVIAAYRESAVIAAKIADVLGTGYPGVLEVVVVADDAPTAVSAREAGARVLCAAHRRGKAAALAEGIAAATHDLCVITDANTALRHGSVSALVRWFADPSIGAVAGDKRVRGGTGEGAYWRFESWLKRREFRLGSTVGLVGELAAVRRTGRNPLTGDTAVDDLWLALDVWASGLRVAYEPAAMAEEEPSPTAGEDWERRTRVVAGTLDVLWRRRACLHPARGLLAAQLWGHRLVRSSVGPLAHAALLALAAVRAPRSGLSRAFLLVHLPGLTAILWPGGRGRAPRSTQPAGQVMYLQAAALGGLVRFWRAEVPACWPKAERAATRRSVPKGDG